MKNLLFTLVIITSCLTTRAQGCYGAISDKQLKEQEEEFVNKSDFIFEGEVLENIYYYVLDSNSNRHLYTSSTLRIDKIVKGANKINLGIITLISNDGIGENGAIIVRNWYSPGAKGIFYCVNSEYPTNGNVIAYGNKIVKFTKEKPTKSGINSEFQNNTIIQPTIPVKYGNGINFGSNHRFKTQQELYDYLKSQGNKVIEKSSGSLKKKENVVANAPVNQQDSVNYASHLAAYQAWLTQAEARISATLEKSNQKKGHHPREKSIEDITFSFANVMETGTSIKYLEFDVMVTSNTNNTYFHNCLLRIGYNTAAFGNSVVFNNRIWLTKGTSFNSVNYLDPQTAVIDQTNAMIGFPFGVDESLSTFNRTLITTSPTQLVHIKIQIDQCGENSGIEFTDISFTPMFSSYTSNANDDLTNILSYDNTSYSTGINQTLCELKIMNFTSPVYPGTWYANTPTSEYLLTINGNGFGATRGNGNVYFSNANNGGQNYTLLDSYDFISWSNSQIKIKMPSVIDTSLYQTTPDPNRYPGSGYFYVKTNAGDSVISTTPIDMPYAVKNVLFQNPTKKYRFDLANVNNSDSAAITFRLDTSITNNPAIEAIVKKAIKEWRCETLVYFEAGADTTLTTAPDGVSVIHLTNSFSVPNRIAVTTIQSNTLIRCLDKNDNKHYFPGEIDIAFLRNPPKPWHLDTLGDLPVGTTDFYETALHELGHADLLVHVNGTTTLSSDKQIMFYKVLTAYPNSIPEIDRRTIDIDAANGGFNIVQLSNGLNINFSLCNASNVGTLILSPDHSCGDILGFEKLLNEDISPLNLYPNPANNGFTVSYELMKNTDVQMTLLDCTGKQLKQYDLKNESSGKHSVYVETNQLSNGLYFFIANINGKTQTMKVIKQ